MTADARPDARPIVDNLIADALARRASDLHVEPVADGCQLRLRIDGLLITESTVDAATGRAIVGRLMVLSQLLTYRLDVPQEGRLSVSGTDLRLSVMPTTHGLRAALRLPGDLLLPRSLGDLGLPDAVARELELFTRSDSGMLIVTGPAGSGKTTTIYGLLQQLVQSARGISIVSLEDPVERDLPGVTQIEVTPFGQLTYERALRSLLRQDPQVLAVGEIRDAATASLAIQAALSGHRLVCTFHASTPAGAVARLLEMGIEPYQITSSVFRILSQRLLRRRDETGYRGRVPVAEVVTLDPAARAAIIRRDDAAELNIIFSQQKGFVSLRDTAMSLVTAGVTDTAEVDRMLGPKP